MDKHAFDRWTMTLAHWASRRTALRLLTGGLLGALVSSRGAAPAQAAQVDPGVLLLCSDSGLTDCFGVCADLSSDEYNCGSCFNVCGNGIPCLGGVCSVSAVVEVGSQFTTCSELGLADCDGYCADLSSDPQNCGACDTDCFPPDICQNGQCLCQPGFVRCEPQWWTSCSDLSSDPFECGACNNVCPSGVCQGGVCTSG